MAIVSIHTERVSNGYIHTKREVITGEEVISVFVQESEKCPTTKELWTEEPLVEEALPPLPKTSMKPKRPVIANNEEDV